MNRQISSTVAEDMAYGQRIMLTTTPDADMKQDTDYLIGTFRIAWRRRRVSIAKYQELSIRYKRRNGTKTEFQKILHGEARPHLFVFEFTDAWVLCSGVTVLNALQKRAGYIGKWNDDKTTQAYYIPLACIAHVLLPKEQPVEAPTLAARPVFIAA